MFCLGRRSSDVNMRSLKRKFDENTNRNEQIAKEKVKEILNTMKY